jgi:uncharacterized protein (DUF1800 family)
MPRTALALQAMFADEDRKKAERERMAAEAAAQPAMATDTSMAANPNTAVASPPSQPANMGPPKLPSPEQLVYRAEALARFQRAAQARAGLIKRLVAFWANPFLRLGGEEQFHPDQRRRFRTRSDPSTCARPFLRHAARRREPSGDAALSRQPAIDRPQFSCGAPSEAGAQRKSRPRDHGVAHARCRRRHTQDDVTSLARILTGWTIAGRGGKLGEPGTFVFNPNAHEPGPQILLGKTYAPEGTQQGEAALLDLARHPATAKHIATKFSRHFVADEPPLALVGRLAGVFSATDGDLKAVTLALIDAPEAWTARLTKMRMPYEFLVAAMRITGRVPEDPGALLHPLAMLGMPFWTPPGPNGFPDTAAAWASPEGMKLRLDVALQAASRLRDPPDPRELLDAIAGGAASEETRQAVARAETKQQGIALLLMSPEVQRR